MNRDNRIPRTTRPHAQAYDNADPREPQDYADAWDQYRSSDAANTVDDWGGTSSSKNNQQQKNTPAWYESGELRAGAIIVLAVILIAAGMLISIVLSSLPRDTASFNAPAAAQHITVAKTLATRQQQIDAAVDAAVKGDSK